MATGSKNGQTKKKPAGRKKPAAKKYNNKLITEAVLLILMALCVIFFLANFGVGGIVGKGISAFFFGLFGILAYIFPILLFAREFLQCPIRIVRLPESNLLQYCLN